jgi:hypothetical protein
MCVEAVPVLGAESVDFLLTILDIPECWCIKEWLRFTCSMSFVSPRPTLAIQQSQQTISIVKVSRIWAENRRVVVSAKGAYVYSNVATFLLLTCSTFYLF